MAQRSLFSPSWYRVANLRPRLRSHARIYRQIFRGQFWYVLQDNASGRYHRFTPAAHLIVSLLDGQRSVQEIWDIASSRLDEDLLTQDEVIRLLAQLHHADVLHGDVPPDIAEQTERAGDQERRRLLMSFANPLAIRIPIFDPERFIRATYPLVSPLFTWYGAILVVGLVFSGATLAVLNWSALTENLSDRVLSAQSLVLIFATYPLVKAIHELGHAFAVKNWGGEVHELGIMFLVFMPVPYVDASASAAFRDKWQRALVGAAGIIVELNLAAIAMIAWLNLEPGLPRAFAFNVILIGGTSTVLFNGNPLLRFDGYYVLSDILEIPNLFQRARRYLLYLIQRYLFGVPDVISPVSARGEAHWFLLYGIASICYRLVIIVGIVTFVASKFFFIGVMMAIWSVTMMYLYPALKGVWYLMTNAALRRRRVRAYAVTLGLVGAIIAFFVAVPLPYATIAQGVVWPPGNSVVHAETDGLVARVLAAPNGHVRRGEPLIEMTDPLLAAQVAVLQAEVKELRLRYIATKVEDRSEATIALERLHQAQAELELKRQRAADLIVTSPIDGVFVLPRAEDMEGRFLHKGDSLGYVRYAGEPVIRVVVNQAGIDAVRQRTLAVSLRLVSAFEDELPARIEREIPSLINSLPSLALSKVGGGDIALDPQSPAKAKTLDRIFQLELRVPVSGPPLPVGERVYVRFYHGEEPLAFRIYRYVRQQFLKRFNV